VSRPAFRPRWQRTVACPTCLAPKGHPCQRLGDDTPQTDLDTAERFARIWGITAPLDLPALPVPESWKVSERLDAYFAGRQPAAWAARDPQPPTLPPRYQPGGHRP
jgi:hypothetical protein